MSVVSIYSNELASSSPANRSAGPRPVKLRMYGRPRVAPIPVATLFSDCSPTKSIDWRRPSHLPVEPAVASSAPVSYNSSSLAVDGGASDGDEADHGNLMESPAAKSGQKDTANNKRKADDIAVANTVDEGAAAVSHDIEPILHQSKKRRTSIAGSEVGKAHTMGAHSQGSIQADAIDVAGDAGSAAAQSPMLDVIVVNVQDGQSHLQDAGESEGDNVMEEEEPEHEQEQAQEQEESEEEEEAEEEQEETEENGELEEEVEREVEEEKEEQDLADAHSEPSAPHSEDQAEAPTTTNDNDNINLSYVDEMERSFNESTGAFGDSGYWRARRIVRAKGKGSKRKFLVEWFGNDPATGQPWADTWEDRGNLPDDLVALFNS